MPQAPGSKPASGRTAAAAGAAAALALPDPPDAGAAVLGATGVAPAIGVGVGAGSGGAPAAGVLVLSDETSATARLAVGPITGTAGSGAADASTAMMPIVAAVAPIPVSMRAEPAGCARRGCFGGFLSGAAGAAGSRSPEAMSSREWAIAFRYRHLTARNSVRPADSLGRRCAFSRGCGRACARASATAGRSWPRAGRPRPGAAAPG